MCVIRAVARQREVLLTQQASWVQRMQKALVQMNIQLTEVISDVMVQTGQAIIRDIVAGERDARALARHRHRRVKSSEQDLVRALTGNWREEHLFVLGQSLAMYDDIAAHLRECDTELRELLAERSAANVDIGKTPRAGSKVRAEFDVRQQLANWAGADLTRINGLGLDSVMKILSRKRRAAPSRFPFPNRMERSPMRQPRQDWGGEPKFSGKRPGGAVSRW